METILSKINESNLYLAECLKTFIKKEFPKVFENSSSEILLFFKINFQEYYNHFSTCESLLHQWLKLSPSINKINWNIQIIFHTLKSNNEKINDMSETLEAQSLILSNILTNLNLNVGSTDLSFKNLKCYSL
jgi:hypothetical protein